MPSPTETPHDLTLAGARALDVVDPCGHHRAAFHLPEGIIYLDGNSLGALPRATRARLAAAMDSEWAEGLIRSWNDAGWIEAPQRIGGKIAQLVGAQADEVIACDSTSVNLFKLLAAAVAARPGRSVILSEAGNFPTDLYMAQGLGLLRPDITLRAVPRAELPEAITNDVAAVMLTHVHYKSAEVWDMAGITAAAHAAGALTIWDLSHSAGAVPVALNDAGADMAVGCGYKYLNGGPGAPAFLYVARAHHGRFASPLSGWMGHAAPFAFTDDYRPAPGVDGFLCGTPPILAMSALEAGVETLLAADLPALFAKGRALGDYFIAAVEALAPDTGLMLMSPRDGAARGSHVSFAHPHGWPVMQALIARGVIGDFRAPDMLRFGFTPLYTRFEDVWLAASALAEVLTTRAWDLPEFHRQRAVT